MARVKITIKRPIIKISKPVYVKPKNKDDDD